MTRINLIDPKLLADAHCFSEYREIKMVPAALRRSLRTRKIGDILANVPARYTLNTGHVTFFYPRMKFLTARYKLLTDELLTRNYDIGDKSGDFTPFLHDLPDVFNNTEWCPDKDEIAINVERILLRLSEKPLFYKYYGKPLDINSYITTL